MSDDVQYEPKMEAELDKKRDDLKSKDSIQEKFDEAYVMNEAMTHPPEFWKILMKYWNLKKTNVLEKIMSRQGLPTEPAARLLDIEVGMEFHNELTHLLKLPEWIIEQGKMAANELKQSGDYDNALKMENKTDGKDPFMSM